MTGVGNRGRGRPKGTPNRSTKQVKEAIEAAFEGLGGVPALTKWAQSNPDAFYGQVWPKLLPIQHKHGGDPSGAPIQVITGVARAIEANDSD